MQDVHAATEAAEEAAEAAEDVADFAEQRPPSGQHLEPEASVGSRPKATTDNEGEEPHGVGACCAYQGFGLRVVGQVLLGGPSQA